MSFIRASDSTRRLTLLIRLASAFTLILAVCSSAEAADYEFDVDGQFFCVDFAQPGNPPCDVCSGVPSQIEFRRTQSSAKGAHPSKWNIIRDNALEMAMDGINGAPGTAVEYTASATTYSHYDYDAVSRRSNSLNEIRFVDVGGFPATTLGRALVHGETVVNHPVFGRLCEFRSADIEFNLKSEAAYPPWYLNPLDISSVPGSEGVGGDDIWRAFLLGKTVWPDIMLHELAHVAGVGHQTSAPSVASGPTYPAVALPGSLGTTNPSVPPGPTAALQAVTERDRWTMFDLHGSGGGAWEAAATVVLASRWVQGADVHWRRMWGEEESYNIVEDLNVQHVVTGADPPSPMAFAMLPVATNPIYGQSMVVNQYFYLKCFDCVPVHTVPLQQVSTVLSMNGFDGQGTLLSPIGMGGMYLIDAPVRTDRVAGGANDMEARYALCVSLYSSTYTHYLWGNYQMCSHPKLVVPFPVFPP